MMTRRSLPVAMLALVPLMAISPSSARGAKDSAPAEIRPGIHPAPGAAPYVRLWTEIDRLDEAVEVNGLTPAALELRLAELTRWYGLFHSPWYTASRLGDATASAGSPTTLAERLAARGAMVSNYRNGSYTMTQGEPAQVESELPLAIGTWWPGHKSAGEGGDTDPAARLSVQVTAAQDAIRVTSAAAHKPESAPETWPYLPSRGKGAEPGARTLNTHDFVSWVGVDDEIMRVLRVKADNREVLLGVERGYFGTRAGAHARAARVMSPVYVGSVGPFSPDARFGGTPHVDEPGKALRYAMKVWRPEFIAFLARTIQTVFGDGRPAPYLQGINTGFLDITSCITYNQADAFAYPVSMWDDPAGTVIQPPAQGRHQIEKVRGLRKNFAAAGYPGMRWIANNIAATERTEACHNQLLSSGDFDGGMIENWLFSDVNFEIAMRQHLAIQEHDWPAVYFIKWPRPPQGISPEQWQRFTYGAYLLGARPEHRRPMYGGQFGLAKPPELFFWDWGPPEEQPAKFVEIPIQICGGKRVYRRKFAHGIILVNAGDSPAMCEMPAGFFDVTRHMPAKSVELLSRDAAFLMRAPRERRR